MLQLFFKTSAIQSKEWSLAYQRIGEITTHFPLKLLRIESYSGRYPDIDKDHLDLVVNRGKTDEHISFYGDQMSFTTGTTIRFYKNWNQFKKLYLAGDEMDTSKPLTWFPPKPFKNDGSSPEANGLSTEYGYIDTRGAVYEYAILAIGTMLENHLPGRVFMTAAEQNSQNILPVVEWLEAHFQEKFELPIYFDKKRLLASFAEHYQDKKDAVGRMEHLYRKQYQRNMLFALENFEYEAVFRFYAETLSYCRFGTFGFSDVLNPWVAATQDLERALQLISESKRLLVEKGDLESADEYDLTRILREFLNDFILWTPQQREALHPFYTNQNALETGDEGLFGSMLRMMGNRVDICPIYASSDELFEAFMYHEPKNGKIFRDITDQWLEKNADAFDNLKQKLSEKLNAAQNKADISDDEDDDDDEIPVSFPNEISHQFPAHERFFMEKVFEANPDYFQQAEILADLRARLHKTIHEEEAHQAYVQQIQSESSADKKTVILSQLKEKRMVFTAGAQFQNWVETEADQNVLLNLRLLLSMKIYTNGLAFARYCVLHEHPLWDFWRTR